MIFCSHYFILVQITFMLKNKIFVFHFHIQNGEDQSIAGDRNSRLDTIHEKFLKITQSSNVPLFDKNCTLITEKCGCNIFETRITHHDKRIIKSIKIP